MIFTVMMMMVMRKSTKFKVVKVNYGCHCEMFQVVVKTLSKSCDELER